MQCQHSSAYWAGKYLEWPQQYPQSLTECELDCAWTRSSLEYKTLTKGWNYFLFHFSKVEMELKYWYIWHDLSWSNFKNPAYSNRRFYNLELIVQLKVFQCTFRLWCFTRFSLSLNLNNRSVSCTVRGKIWLSVCLLKYCWWVTECRWLGLIFKVLLGSKNSTCGWAGGFTDSLYHAMTYLPPM